MRKKLRVVVLMGGKSPEHEVSLLSGREVVRHLDPEKYEVLPLIVSKDGQRWQLKAVAEFLLTAKQEISSVKDLAPTRKEIAPDEIPQWADVVFIAMHGVFGEDGTVQGMLELGGIPYTGAGVLASALGMDKPIFRKVIKEAGITIPKYLVLEKRDKIDEIWRNFKLPVVVKPSSQGSSVGVNIVHQKRKICSALDKAFSFGPRIMVEEYLVGTEVTCGVIGNNNLQALPVVEIIPKKEFFDYEAKYVFGMCEEIVPARISAELTKMVQETAIKVYRAIGCRGLGRVDMIISRGKPYVLEINTIPGLTPNSLLPKEAATAGISFPRLIEKLIDFALE